MQYKKLHNGQVWYKGKKVWIENYYLCNVCDRNIKSFTKFGALNLFMCTHGKNKENNVVFDVFAKFVLNSNGEKI